MRLLGRWSAIAVRLVQRRDLSRSAPHRPACEVSEPQTLLVLAARTAQSPSSMTMGTDLGQKSHASEALWPVEVMAPPGWKTLWKGWLSLQTLLEGVQLGSLLRL